MRFVDWDHRPAVLGGTEARAMLRPEADWVKVDFWDVVETAGVMDESTWRRVFKTFGANLKPPTLDQSPGERAEAARAAKADSSRAGLLVPMPAPVRQ